MEKISWKHQNRFQGNRLTISQIVTICTNRRITCKQTRNNEFVVDFPLPFQSIIKGTIENIFLVYVTPQKYCYRYDYVKLVTLVEGDPKAPFSIATTTRCCEGSTPFPRLLHFTLVTYRIRLSVKQREMKYHF